jgi:twitching motility protein PilU
MEFEDLLKLMVQKGGSDMFITAGVPPSVKLNGKICPSPRRRSAPSDARSGAGRDDRTAAQGIRPQTKECNFAISARGIGRFRVSGLLPAQSRGHGVAPHRNQYSESGRPEAAGSSSRNWR